MIRPLTSIRKYCIYCCNGNKTEVRNCTAVDCPSHPFRYGRKPKENNTSVLKSIRAKCIDCSSYLLGEVRKCQHTDCSLYPYRMGTNPNRVKILPSVNEVK